MVMHDDKIVASFEITRRGTLGIPIGTMVHIRKMRLPYGRSKPGDLYYDYYTRRTKAHGINLAIVQQNKFSEEILEKLMERSNIRKSKIEVDRLVMSKTDQKLPHVSKMIKDFVGY